MKKPYAIVQLQGKQYLVHEGETIVVDALNKKEGESFDSPDVLLLVTEKATTVGEPTVSKAKVSFGVAGHTKDKKIRVATYKAKSRYRKVKGHRSHKTELVVNKISQ